MHANICTDMRRIEFQSASFTNRMVTVTSKISVFIGIPRKRILVVGKSKSSVLTSNGVSASLVRSSASLDMITGSVIRSSQCKFVKITCLGFVQMAPIVNFNTLKACFSQVISNFQFLPIFLFKKIGLMGKCI